MRTFQIIVLAGISVLTMSNSCKKENAETPAPCSTVALTISQVSGWTETPTCLAQSPTNIGQSQLYVLNSDAEYKVAFNCSSLPAVDFNKFTLLVGETKTAYGSHVASQKVVQTCSGYEYSVTIQNGITTVISTLAYHALVPKISTSAKVSLKVQVLPF